MKIKTASWLMALPLILSMAQSVHAECGSNKGDLSFNSSTMSSEINANAANGMYWPLKSPPTYIRSYALINCNEHVPNLKTTAKSSVFRPTDGNNIDLNRSKNIAGRTFYKIVNTENPFANQHGYITFQIQDTKAGKPILEISPNVVFYDRVPRESSTQGIIVHSMQIFFDQIPSIPIEVNNMSLGMLYLTLETETQSFQDQQKAYISLSYAPPILATCDVSGTHVTLPTMLSSAFQHLGDEAGQTPFKITALCPSQAVNQDLLGLMLDSNDLNNHQVILSNSNTASNIALKIYAANTQQPIQFGEYFNYGRFEYAAMPSISKDFYVRYYKTDDQPTVAGPVNGQVTMSVVYR